MDFHSKITLSEQPICIEIADSDYPYIFQKVKKSKKENEGREKSEKET